MGSSSQDLGTTGVVVLAGVVVVALAIALFVPHHVKQGRWSWIDSNIELNAGEAFYLDVVFDVKETPKVIEVVDATGTVVQRFTCRKDERILFEKGEYSIRPRYEKSGTCADPADDVYPDDKYVGRDLGDPDHYDRVTLTGPNADETHITIELSGVMEE